MRTALMLMCIALMACSSKETPKATPVVKTVSTEALMQRLLAVMEMPTKQADTLMREGATEFFERSDAVKVLTDTYHSTVAAWPRWKLLRLAGKTQRADANAFLFDEALKPVTPQHTGGEGNAFSVTNEEYVNRLEAALGVVSVMPQQGSSQVEQIIQTVDISIARIVGSQLFSLGYLNTALLAALQARGLPTDYRRMSDGEERALSTIQPSRWRQP